MVKELKKKDSNDFNKIMERPVDIFYGDKTEIISLGFKDLPKANNGNSESFEKKLKNIWDQHFPDTDNIVDFLRYCVYHTGLAGRFFKMNSALSLDNVVYLLKSRLPNPDTSFKVWHKLHKVATVLLKDICKESAFDVSLVLDLHISTDGVCDSSKNKIEGLSFDELSSKHGSLLVYHIMISYKISHEPILTGRKSFNSFSNNNCKDFHNKSEISKCISSSNQSESSHTDMWQKYGARPKLIRYSQKNCSNTTEKGKQLEITDPVKKTTQTALPESSRHDNRVTTKKRQSLSASIQRVEKILADKQFLNELDSFVTEVKNTKTLHDTLLPSFSDVVKKCDAYLNGKENSGYLSSFSRPSALPPPLPPSESDLNFPATSEDDRWWQKSGARPKNPVQRYDRCDREISESNKEIKTVGIPEKAAADLYANDEFIFSGHFANVQSAKAISEAEKSLNVPGREVQEAYDSLLSSFASATAEYENPDDSTKKMAERIRLKIMSEIQKDTSLQFPFINFPGQSAQKNIAVDDPKISNFGMNTDEKTLQVRESIFKHQMNTFFENYKFPKAGLDDKSLGAAKNPGESCSAFPPPVFEFNPTALGDPRRSPENVSNVGAQAAALSNDEQNPGHLSVKSFDDKISFNWEYFPEKETPVMENPDPVFFKDTSGKNTEEFYENNKMVFVDGEPMPIETAADFYDTFFKNIVLKLTALKSKKTSPEHSQSLQSTTHEEHSTPPKNATYTEVLKFANIKKTDEVESQDNAEKEMFSADEVLSEPSEESLGLSDNDNSD